MAVQPLSPATRLRLGEPLPHQLPDRTQVAPSAHCCFHLSAYGVLATVSRSCPPPQGTSLCFTHPSAAISSKIHRSLIQKKPLNLHVLSTPPAFILSQDQTLRKINRLSLARLTCLASLHPFPLSRCNTLRLEVQCEPPIPFGAERMIHHVRLFVYTFI